MPLEPPLMGMPRHVSSAGTGCPTAMPIGRSAVSWSSSRLRADSFTSTAFGLLASTAAAGSLSGFGFFFEAAPALALAFLPLLPLRWDTVPSAFSPAVPPCQAPPRVESFAA